MKGPKADKIKEMFDAIAPDYDRLNHVLSLGIDRTWRRRALRHIVDRKNPQSVLDVACGTGDFSILIARHSCPGTVVKGLDLSEGMLEVMRDKVARAGLSAVVSASCGDCTAMDFQDNTFDVVTIAFGIRNFEDRERALREILRVLKPGGRLVILELSVPSAPVVRQLYSLYSLRLLPAIGGLLTGEKSAYRYLPASILAFPGPAEWMAVMNSCGYKNLKHKAFTFGICRMYIGEKL